ncbi:MAG: hypothetical protein K2H43_03145, partial [Clostridia bacterium]|nr:hypothetical protein [Clostridia bacterium]
QEIERLRADYEEQLTQQQLEFAQKLEDTISEYEEQAAGLRGQIDDLNASYREAEERFAERVRELNAQIADLSDTSRRLNAEFESKTRELEDKYAREYEAQELVSRQEMDKMREETAFMRGQMNAMRVQNGHLTPSTDYASRERFLELQAEYAAFEKFFKQQWKLTKREIRKEVLWAKRGKPENAAEAETSPAAPSSESAERISGGEGDNQDSRQ